MTLLPTLREVNAGGVYCCGLGDGRLGLPNLMAWSTPQRVWGLEGHRVVEVSAGNAHTIARTLDGKFFGWGIAKKGELGAQPTATVATPALIQFF